MLLFREHMCGIIYFLFDYVVCLIIRITLETKKNCRNVTSFARCHIPFRVIHALNSGSSISPKRAKLQPVCEAQFSFLSLVEHIGTLEVLTSNYCLPTSNFPIKHTHHRRYNNAGIEVGREIMLTVR